ncbi:MAG: DUF192 domain-containing protein [Rhodobacter sp.]|nr:DUF192 domain-containing protein [Rhodobacter sp.]
MKLFAAAVVVWAASVAAAWAACEETRVDLRGDWGTARFTVELADSPDERALGLMNRPKMAASAGMLFLYEFPQRVAFWMENTLIPLDMIFMGPDGVVRHIHENAVPLDRSLIPGGDGILAVLEINGGMSSLLGITVGSQLRHPMLDQAIAAWPCDTE